MDSTDSYYSYAEEGGVPAHISISDVRAKYAAIGTQQGNHPGRSVPNTMLTNPDIDKRADHVPTQNISPGMQHNVVVGAVIVGALFLVWKSANLK